MLKKIIFLSFFISDLLFSSQKVQTVTIEDFKEFIPFGTIAQSKFEQIVSTKINGYIMSIKVKVGDCVKKGDLLVSIDPIESKSQVDVSNAMLLEARASLKKAKTNLLRQESSTLRAKLKFEDSVRNFKRIEALHQKKAISDMKFEKAKLQMEISKQEYQISKDEIKQAEEAIKSAKAILSAKKAEARMSENIAGYFSIKASYDALITKTFKENHELVSPSEPILHLAALSPLKLSVKLPSYLFNELKLNQKLQIRTQDSENKFKEATVTALVPYARPGVYSYEVRLEADDEDLLAGMYVEVLVPKKTQRLASIKPSAITFRGGIRGVFVLENDIVKFRPINILAKYADKLGVDNLKENDKIVLYPSNLLEDGKKFP